MHGSRCVCGMRKDLRILSEISVFLTRRGRSSTTWILMATYFLVRKSLKRLKVPPYTVAEATMWSPLLHSPKIVDEMAAIPE